MKATVIVDNIGTEELSGEWGLCVLIEYNGRKILLDTGASDLYLTNLKALGFEIEDVDYAVLSHAHYDHAGGMKSFFENNRKAKFYVSSCACENCFSKFGPFRSYVGIPVGTIGPYSDRLEIVKDKTEIIEGVYVVPHKKATIPCGKKQHLYVKKNGKLIPDDFDHEQSLVFRTASGLVIFNSCSHTGADSIIAEVMETFPGEKVYAIMGGFHLVTRTSREIRKIGEGILSSGIERVYTGHCSKERGYTLIKKVLGDKAEQFRVGLVIDIE